MRTLYLKDNAPFAFEIDSRWNVPKAECICDEIICEQSQERCSITGFVIGIILFSIAFNEGNSIEAIIELSHACTSEMHSIGFFDDFCFGRSASYYNLLHYIKVV